jgi:hypothetical protein
MELNGYFGNKATGMEKIHKTKEKGKVFTKEEKK